LEQGLFRSEEAHFAAENHSVQANSQHDSILLRIAKRDLSFFRMTFLML
jgi:hypothetical protein